MEIADKAAHLFDLRVGVDVNFFVLRAVDHFGGQNARRAVKRRERLVDLRHLAADGRLLFDDIDLETRLCDIERRLNARNAAADDKRPLRDRASAGGKRRVQLHLCNRGSAQNNRLFRRFLLVLMNPGALLADVRDLNHVVVEPRFVAGLAERLLMHPGRARTDDHACEPQLLNFILNHLLAGLGAHVGIVGRKHHAGLFPKRLGDLLNIHRRGNVRAAVADKYANFLHVLPPLPLVFPERAYDRLLRQLVIQYCRNLLGMQVIFALLADNGQPDGLDELRGLDVSWAPLHAGKAAQARINAPGS